VVLLSFAYGVGVGIRHWPPYALLKRILAPNQQARFEESQCAEAAAPVALLIRDGAGPSKPEQARLAREFVYDHSVHGIDDQHAQYAWDTPRVLRMLHQHYLTREKPPHLSCGPRALALQAILDALSIENRVVHTYSGDYEEIRSHTFVEVFDEKAGRWVIHDPGYDVTYVDPRTDRQVSLLRLVVDDPRSALPVSRRGRGWEVNEIDHLRDHYFQVAKYDARAGDSDILVVNGSRFHEAKRFPANDGMTLREFSKKLYRRPVFLPVDTVSRLPEGN
jgi:hypothetical protein